MSRPVATYGSFKAYDVSTPEDSKVINVYDNYGGGLTFRGNGALAAAKKWMRSRSQPSWDTKKSFPKKIDLKALGRGLKNAVRRQKRKLNSKR